MLQHNVRFLISQEHRVSLRLCKAWAVCILSQRHATVLLTTGIGNMRSYPAHLLVDCHIALPP